MVLSGLLFITTLFSTGPLQNWVCYEQFMMGYTLAWKLAASHLSSMCHKSGYNPVRPCIQVHSPLPWAFLLVASGALEELESVSIAGLQVAWLRILAVTGPR